MNKTDPLVGKTIGNHVVSQRLGGPATGGLYLAEHPQMGSRVVVKVLPPEHVLDAALVRRMLDEARTTNRIDHPGVVRVVDYGTVVGVVIAHVE